MHACDVAQSCAFHEVACAHDIMTLRAREEDVCCVVCCAVFVLECDVVLVCVSAHACVSFVVSLCCSCVLWSFVCTGCVDEEDADE
jgi:hypothetical protein